MRERKKKQNFDFFESLYFLIIKATKNNIYTVCYWRSFKYRVLNKYIYTLFRTFED
jgi:hypothetical protein